jgi:thiamine-monophosphate kinase
VKYSGPTIFELGESEALKRAVAVFKRGEHTLVGSGDDAAVIASAGKYVVTTDTMVEGRDFRTDFSSGYDLGYKAVASNVADVAAMGAKPTALVVAVVVTTSTTVAWLEHFAAGLQAGIDNLAPGAEIVGGDIARGTEIVIAVTAHGELSAEPVLRSGAKPGDVVALAGTLGRAACGLDLLLSPDETLAKAYDEWVEVQLRPNPPIALGQLAAGIATAMMDVSDGLSTDATRLAKASGVSIKLSSGSLSGYEAVLELAAQSMVARGFVASERDWVLHGGEDHSLLATFPAGAVLPRGFKVIGEVIAQAAQPLYLDSEPLVAKGWDSVSS